MLFTSQIGIKLLNENCFCYIQWFSTLLTKVPPGGPARSSGIPKDYRRTLINLCLWFLYVCVIVCYYSETTKSMGIS